MKFVSQAVGCQGAMPAWKEPFNVLITAESGTVIKLINAVSIRGPAGNSAGMS